MCIRDAHQPRGRVIKGVGVTGTVPRPRHLRGDDPMLGAAHPWRVRFQERPDLTEVQGPPPPPAFALVIAGAALPAATAATLGRLPGSRRHHEDLFDLVELDVFHDDLGQPEQPSPQPCRTHAVSLTLDSGFQTAGTVGGARRVVRQAPSGAHGRVTRAEKVPHLHALAIAHVGDEDYSQVKPPPVSLRALVCREATCMSLAITSCSWTWKVPPESSMSFPKNPSTASTPS